MAKGRPPKDKNCVRIDMCVRDNLNQDIIKYQASQIMIGLEIKKPEAAEDFVHMLHNFYIEHQKVAV